MLEEDLRRMFAAQVAHTPSALEPAVVAIKRGRRSRLRRNTTNSIVTLVVFAALLSGAIVVQGLLRAPSLDAQSPVTAEGLWGRPGQGSDTKPVGETLPTLDSPLDVVVDNQIWAAGGANFTLSAAGQVMQVVRVPAGWLYSDDFKLRLRTLQGKTFNLTEKTSSWVVSPDGSRYASINGTKLDVTTLADRKVAASTTVRQGISPVTFADRDLMLRSDEGQGRWKAGAQLDEVWNPQVLAVFSSAIGGAIGVALVNGQTCLVEVVFDTAGVRPGLALGCDELAATAVTSASLSPDGRMLAIPSVTGVHMIDVPRSRAAFKTGQTKASVVAFTCASAPNAAAYWAGPSTMLTLSDSGGIVACLSNGSRLAVPLPAGVTDNWQLVPSYGVLN